MEGIWSNDVEKMDRIRFNWYRERETIKLDSKMREWRV